MYVPVLKAKPGEYKAMRNAGPSVVSDTRVIFEVVPTHGEDRDVSDFVNGVAPGWPLGAVVTVDTGSLDQTLPINGTADRAVLWTSQRLRARNVAAKPVMRQDDPFVVLSEVAAAAAIHGQGACLRLGSEESDPEPDDADALVPDALETVGLGVDEIDLVIDLWSVASQREVQRAVPVAIRMLAWAAQLPWRSVSVVSGAFPASISNLPTGGPTPIQRHDADLYDAILAAGPDTVPDYGDFGVAHPGMPTSVPRGPLPNLRYTSDREWQVDREQRILPGNQSFFTICQRVVASPYWPGPTYSWGDHEINRCANSTGGAGTATEWRAFGTSHHLAHVVDRLATLGGP